METGYACKHALVTGASSGIGKAYAELLAAGGADLTVVARNEERLKELARDLLARHGSNVEILKADLETRSELARVEERLRDRADIDLLVNNAGYGHTGDFAGVPLDKAQGQIDCNIVALTRLTHAALTSMRAARRGGILNVASGAAFLPTPGMAVYAATKAYVLGFTQALHEEVKSDGVRLSVVCPGFTRTEFQDRAKYDTRAIPGFAWQTPEEVARESLAALAAGKIICVPGAGNKVAMGIVGMIPRRAVAGLVARLSPRSSVH